MAKPEFLQFLAPIAALGATALSGGLGAPLLGAEAAGEGAAAGAAEAVPFLAPGTDLPLISPDIAGSFSLADAVPGLAGAGEAATAGAGLLGAEGGAGGLAGGAAGAPGVAAAAPLATGAPAVSGPIDTAAATALSSSPTTAASTAPALGSGISAASDLTGPAAGSDIYMSTIGAPASLTPADAGGGTFGGVPGAPVQSAPLGAPGGTLGDFTNTASDFSSGAGAPATDAGGGVFGGIGDFAGKAGDYAINHPGALLTGGILASQMFKGNPAYPAEASLGTQAATNAGEAAALTAPLNTGILPPGAQQFVNTGEKAAEATTRSAYGNLGLSGSTMEADAIGAAKQRAAAQQFQIADQLLQSGGQFSSLASNDYNSVLRAQIARDQNYQQALANFARALGGAGYTAPAVAAASG